MRQKHGRKVSKSGAEKRIDRFEQVLSRNKSYSEDAAIRFNQKLMDGLIQQNEGEKKLLVDAYQDKPCFTVGLLARVTVPPGMGRGVDEHWGE
jgi:hypothetical protein